MSQAAFAGAIWDGCDAAAARVAPAQRLAIHRNNVLAALGAALAVRFPVTRQLVGDTFFAVMASAFVKAQPPASPLLIDYGGDYPTFIVGFAPAQGVPYLADVARLESAWWRAYHAADAAVAKPDVFSAIPAERLAAVRLLFHPAASLVPSAWPVASIWRAHKAGGDMRGIDLQQPETALVSRPGLDVTIEAVSPATGSFIAGLVAGNRLGETAEAVLSSFPGFDLAGGLRQLIAAGIVAHLRVED